MYRLPLEAYQTFFGTVWHGVGIRLNTIIHGMFCLKVLTHLLYLFAFLLFSLILLSSSPPSRVFCPCFSCRHHRRHCHRHHHRRLLDLDHLNVLE
jgi:hypothetical protein